MGVEVSTALPAVTLDEAKLHLRVESTADDDLISALILACTQMAEHELQRGLVTREGTEGYGDSPEAVPVAIRQWILVHVAYYYEHRTSATEGALSPLPFVSALLDPFRTWT